MRAVESILNQSYSDLELIVADCASRDRTPSMLESFHDRDIRVELLRREEDDLDAGMEAGMEAARGAGIMLVRQDDWLSPGMLERMVAVSGGRNVDLVFPARSEDLWDARERSCTARARRMSDSLLDGRAELHHAIGDLFERGVVSQAFGVLVERDRALDHRLSLKDGDDGFSYVLACLEDAETVAVADGPCYHSVAFGAGGTRPFDPAFSVRCADEHRGMMGLLKRWGIDHDLDAVIPVHRHHVRRLIECIDNASIGSSRISSIERIGRVQDMIDDEDARVSLAAVQPSSDEFGIMYKPMTKRNAAGCCMGSRLRELARISHLPLGPIP